MNNYHLADKLPVNSTVYSEMLGNKYFLARNYRGAAQNLQYVLSQNPVNKAARKKIIICYTQIGEIEKAFENFYILLREDINFIINTDPVADDCPCPELISKYDGEFPYGNKPYHIKLTLAMLWLYCDVEKSLELFGDISSDTEDLKIHEIFSLIENNKKSINKKTN